jgi:DNA-directed RNA polymerase specialized sigma24 family protein
MFEDTYVNARNYLGQVKETQEMVDILEKRISLRKEIGIETDELEEELVEAREDLKVQKSNTAESLSRLSRPNVALVMIKRYVDLETWVQIAQEMDMTVRSVQSLHGYGLVEMEAQLGDKE